MFSKSVIKNQGIINNGKKAIINGRTAATSSQMQGLRVDDIIKPDPVQYAVMMLTDIDGARKISHEIMNQKLHDFEVRDKFVVRFLSSFRVKRFTSI